MLTVANYPSSLSIKCHQSLGEEYELHKLEKEVLKKIYALAN
jgi:hypothetical protein